MSGIEVASGALSVGKVLCSSRVRDFFFKWDIDHSLFRDLETHYNHTKVLLNDVEVCQMEDRFVAWFQHARFAILDAEDLLDSILTDINVENYRLGDSPTTYVRIKEKLRYKGEEIVSAFHPYKKLRVTEMNEMVDKLKSIMVEAANLGVDKMNELKAFREKRVSTSSDTHPSDIVGRSEDERNIMNILSSREGDDDALRVICIIAMGGVGKTTLAQMVFNAYKSDPDQVFQVTSWICVSDKFETTRVIKSLLESVSGGDSMAINNLETCQLELKKKLQDKRFLIVLDDVWDDVEDKWETLRTIFSIGAPGSRIIVTTRKEKVLAILSTSHQSAYKLKELSNDEGWLLFKRHAFQNEESRTYPNLEKIGKEIVNKCKGSPLAIKMLARALLSKENDEKEWDFVLHSKIWSSTTNILPSLWLSYYHLPLPIKQCFSYFSIFPKDHKFSMKKMTMLWMAEGFVDKPRESGSHNDHYEHLARSYFKHLSANFFIEPISGNISRFVMHDLIHDLAEYVSKDVNVSWTDVKQESRRLPYIADREKLLNISSVTTPKRLRTLLRGECLESDSYFFNYKVCNNLLSDFKLLRVLSLKYCGVSVLPASIGDMKLLRYLNLSWTNIDNLPHWICRLYNLQVLKVSHCPRLKRLPTEFCDLVNLRHLITKDVKFKEIPDGIGKMASLQTLPAFVINKGESRKFREFGNLLNLHGKFKISGMNNIDDVQDVVTASFGTKEYLEKLALKWKLEERDTVLDERVLDALRPHKNLKILRISYFGGKRLSDWIVKPSPSFNGILSLSIFGCFNLEALPSIGVMPSLEALRIGSLDSLESLGEEFYGDIDSPFPALQTLNIGDMKILKTMKGCKRGFSLLKELRIDNCPELTEIPGCFPSLTELVIIDCANLRSLASIGNLPFLNHVHINGLHCLDSLDDDFYGDSRNPFPALETLEIVDMENLNKWCFPGGKRGFSVLTKLQIHDCGELTEIPGCFPSLTELMIRKCANLRSLASIGNLPFLRHVHIERLHCLDSLDEDFYGDSRNPFSALETLEIVDMKNLSKWCFPGGDKGGFCSLKRLQVEECPKLIDIPYCFPSLITLKLLRCNNLVGLEMCDAEEESVSSSTTCGPSLRHVKIVNCAKLRHVLPLGAFLPTDAAVQNSALEELVVEDGSSIAVMELLSKERKLLTRFTSLKRLVLQVPISEDGSEEMHESEGNCDEHSVARLPLSLSDLKIVGGIYRKILAEVCNLKFLTELILSDCDAVESFPDIEMPSELKYLCIENCSSLRTIPDRFLVGCHKRLKKLILVKCPNLAHLPDAFSALESLLSLRIFECSMLKSLPDGFHNIISLQILKLSDCPNLSPPEDGFPSMITKLTISFCGKMDPVSKMKLSQLTSLTDLDLKGFPDTTTLDHCIPESIEILCITDFPRLKSLTGVLPTLKRLRYHAFDDCPLLVLTQNESKSWSKTRDT